jgi:hypothetical protein
MAFSHAGRFQDACSGAVLQTGIMGGSIPFQAIGAKGNYNEHLEYFSED